VFSVIGVFQKGFADSKSENRTSVIAPTVPISSVSTKAIPEFQFRIGGYSVGTNSNASRGNPVLTKLPIFEKEVDTTLRPAAVAPAITQQPATADAAYQKRYGDVIRDANYFSEELVHMLFSNDRALLASRFPG
jgi:hypothetical protein